MEYGPGETLSGLELRLRFDLNTVTTDDFPARFDASIIGCTTLRRAFINLRKHNKKIHT